MFNKIELIMKSILDTDLYKFSMSYAYMKLFPEAEGKFKFIDREKNVFNEEFLNELVSRFHGFSSISLTLEECVWAKHNIPYIPGYYWEWLYNWRFDPSVIHVGLKDDGTLEIEVTDKLYKATLYEVIILAAVSELMMKYRKNFANISKVIEKLDTKISLSNQEKIYFADMGTRRRFSTAIQEEVVKRLSEKALYCTGTSNVWLAMKYNMKPIGTCAHEYFSFHGAMYGYKSANYVALENWVNVFDGYLGIALTDTYTSDVFFKNFSKKHAKLFDGVRQDSGDEYRFVMSAIKRYKELGVDPSTKTIVFSNALDFEKAKDINEYCKGRIKASFGIGTNLTNDTGNKPANIVMKLAECRMSSREEWSKCVKISDDLGKHTGESEEIDLCFKTLGL